MRNYIYEYFYNGKKVRIMVDRKSHEFWFCARDIAKILKYSNIRKAICEFIPPQHKRYIKIDTRGGKQKMAFIDSAGLSAILIRSRKTDNFKYWLNNEAIKSIIQNGAYISDKVLIKKAEDRLTFTIDDDKEILKCLHGYNVGQDIDKIVKYKDYLKLEEAYKLEKKRRLESEREIKRLLEIIDRAKNILE